MAKTDNVRKYSGGGPRPDLTEIKRKEGAERQEAWSKLTPQQQLDELDRRLGKGVGATKQRARLALVIEKSKHRAQPAPKGAEPVGQLIERSGENVKAKERRAAEQAKRPSK